ncbi:MAG: Extracellular solute-binding protein family 1 [Candidatus Moranbacteria bacterium GW2011_GWE1_35_17]|nr:MAG: Extracellular solute-binding protein family 1 [Candidatus Moranbacteria bacterium GW2011_GWE1_35_17]KKP80607.1 MAG: Extracellular solute-binding protein family 1 [Candidatus Moranbacteria bacterium GW2011_GWF1_35_5]KKP81733.1 MAG: Extracellular solute-binding protein family 1 [Candidatus Moranbacteria bacterium GW2011_GWF2_35_54]
MIKNKKKYKIKIVALLLAIFMIVPVVSGCAETKSQKYLVDLEVWGSFDDNNDFSEILAELRAVNPFIEKVVYKKIPIDSYESELIDAMAAGNGPDIFLVNNAWMPRFEDKVAPAPNDIIIEKDFRANFIDIVANEFIGKNGEIYGAPLSVDSLALYYNKDLFNAAGITSAPTTWSELLDDSKKLTRIDEVGEIKQSGIAMGTIENINRSTDIVDLLMLQNGAQMPSRDIIGFKPDYSIAKNVLGFYTQFSKFSSPAYTWNKRMNYSIDAFYKGDLAMMMNYSWHMDTIKSKNSKLDFSIAPIPQISSDKPVNFANYWSFVVNKNKQIKQKEGRTPINNEIRIHEAWQFLKFLTFKNDGKFTAINYKTKNKKEYVSKIDPASLYIEKTKRPAARRDLIEKQKTDPTLSPFAYGNLIAKTWYKKNSNSVEGVWAEAIESINKGDFTTDQALRSVELRMAQINK